MSKICAIISGGEYAPLSEIEKADFLICCDKGYAYARQNSLTPDLLIGDFDSYQAPLPDDIPTVTLPHEKDDTDTLYAVRTALQNCGKLLPWQVKTISIKGELLDD